MSLKDDGIDMILYLNDLSVSKMLRHSTYISLSHCIIIFQVCVHTDVFLKKRQQRRKKDKKNDKFSKIS